jgi:glycosyltransferase involved in cell wall biosynthesis
MRVLYLHQYFTTPDMAGGTRSYEMARRLVAAGHTVHMITTDREGRNPRHREWRRELVSGIDVHWLPVPYSNEFGYRARMRAFGDFAWRAATRAVEIGGDLVFATSTPLTIAIPGIYASRRLRVPMIFEVRDLWPEVPIAMGVVRNPVTIAAAYWLARAAYRHAAHVVALSPGLKEGVLRHGIPAERVSVISNGCDRLFDVSPEVGAAFRRGQEWLGDRPLVTYAGTLGPANGVGYLAQLAAEAQRLAPEVRFLVVGSGKEEPAIRRTAGELGVMGRNFFMMPSLPKREIPACLSATDLAVSLLINVPALGGPALPNKFFDALAARRPILINYEGWLAELLRSTGAGLVIPPDDPQRGAAELCEFLRDPCRGAQARSAAGELATGPFNRDRLAEELMAVFQRAVGQAHDG